MAHFVILGYFLFLVFNGIQWYWMVFDGMVLGQRRQAALLGLRALTLSTQVE